MGYFLYNDCKQNQAKQNDTEQFRSVF